MASSPGGCVFGGGGGGPAKFKLRKFDSFLFGCEGGGTGGGGIGGNVCGVGIKWACGFDIG